MFKASLIYIKPYLETTQTKPNLLSSGLAEHLLGLYEALGLISSAANPTETTEDPVFDHGAHCSAQVPSTEEVQSRVGLPHHRLQRRATQRIWALKGAESLCTLVGRVLGSCTKRAAAAPPSSPQLIYMHWMNTVVNYCGPFEYEVGYCEKLKSFLETNLEWMQREMELSQDSPYWHQVGWAALLEGRWLFGCAHVLC